jgi:DNA-binding Lrp family transcriptional regulator
VAALSNDARLSNKELAAQVGLAPSSSLVRTRRLVQDGVLRGFHAQVSPEAMGIGLQAIIEVRLRRHSRRSFHSLHGHIQSLPEIMQVFHVSGPKDLLLHVAVRDIAHLRDLIVDRLATRAEVANCETSVIFSTFRQPRMPRYSEGRDEAPRKRARGRARGGARRRA